MGRYKKYRPERMIQIPLQSGGAMTFAAPSSTRLSQEIATRETAFDFFKTMGYLPNPSETLRKIGREISEYKYLLEDAHVNGCMESRIAGTLSLDWTLDRNGSLSRQYTTIKAILDGWPMSDIMHEILYAVFFGYQPVEVLWESTGGMLLPKAIAPKDPNWFRFNEENELRYLTQENQIEGVPVPNYKFIMPRYRPSYERPYGRPLGSVVYWPVKFRHSGLRFYCAFVEKYGTPWLRAEYPLGAQAARVQEMINMLDTTVQDGIIAHPSEFKVEALKMNDGSSSDIHDKYIQLMNEEISIGILGQTLTTKMDESGGSFAAAKVHGGIRDDIVSEDTKIIEMVYNTLIGWIYELNWPAAGNQPKFQMISPPNPTKDDAQMAVYLEQTGIKYTKEFYQNRFDLLDTEFELKTAAEMAPAIKPVSPEDVSPDDKSGDTATLTHETKDTAGGSAKSNDLED